jgi:hypothetical protein
MNAGGSRAENRGDEPPESDAGTSRSAAEGEHRRDSDSGLRATLVRVAPAIGLFFLAPLVGEFLLGNVAIDALVGLLILAPMYGGAAVVIREVARRNGRGWPTMLLLGLAYAVFEEGLVTQSLFNSNYFNANLLSETYIPALGIGVWWTLFVLTLHTVWSINVPIALVEALVPSRSRIPWLGNVGLLVAGVLLALGSYVSYATTYDFAQFIAPMPQLVGAAVIVVLLIIAAFALPVHQRGAVPEPVPDPWFVGVASFLLSSLFMVATLLGGQIPAAVVVVIYVVLEVAAVWLVWRWSRRAGWGPLHVLALAGGALLTYAWHAYPQPPSLGTPGQIDLIGNAVFALGAVLLLVVAVRAQQRHASDVDEWPLGRHHVS